jgi:hypothetical protein
MLWRSFSERPVGGLFKIGSGVIKRRAWETDLPHSIAASVGLLPQRCPIAIYGTQPKRLCKHRYALHCVVWRGVENASPFPS